jgi:hypothetical protein
MSDYGHKKILCRRLYDAKVPEVVEVMGPIIERGGPPEGEKQLGEQEQSARSTPDLASSRYVAKKLDEWDATTKQSYVKAYDSGDWDKIYALTDDLSGSAYSMQNTFSELYNVIKEQLGGKR